MQSNIKTPKNVGAAATSRYDDRKGLGYGQLTQKFHKPRPADNTFPYEEPDLDLEDVEIDDAAQDAINSKTLNFQRTDPGAEKSTDPLYFVGAATKLRACFEHPDDVLEEIMATGKAMQVSGEYGPRDAAKMAVGGFSSWKAFDIRPYKRTGTKKGWSESPPLSKVAAEEQIADDEFYNLKDLADIQRPSLGECFGFNQHT